MQCKSHAGPADNLTVGWVKWIAMDICLMIGHIWTCSFLYSRLIPGLHGFDVFPLQFGTGLAHFGGLFEHNVQALYILPTWCAQMPFKHVHIFGLGHATARNLGTDSFLCRWFLWVAACWTWCARLGATCIDMESDNRVSKRMVHAKCVRYR